VTTTNVAIYFDIDHEESFVRALSRGPGQYELESRTSSALSIPRWRPSKWRYKKHASFIPEATVRARAIAALTAIKEKRRKLMIMLNKTDENLLFEAAKES
jgi:hypothetical protein